MRIALLGDIALFGRMSVNDNPKLSEYFQDIATYLSHFDYVVGNLETPFSVAKKTKGAKSAYICSDIENVQILRNLHINSVSLANNHMFDFGGEGYETTKRVLSENDIDYFGTEGKDVKVDFNGNKLAFSGFCCYSTNPLQCVPYGSYGVNSFNYPMARQILRNNAESGYLNIFAVHAGLEHINFPSIDHVRIARKLSEEAPYVYYGHHPHVIQGLEEHYGSLLSYSLGNFCFDDIYTKASGCKPLVTLTENNRHGLILELNIENNQIVSWREQLIYNSKGERMELVKETESLEVYNEAVVNCVMDAQAYNTKRKKLLDDWMAERKTMRNFMWYVRRLRPQYVKLILDGRRNENLYNDNIKKYVDGL